MDVEIITTLISSVGFPIVACAALFIMVRDMNKAHKEEIDALRETISENTKVLTRIESIINMIDRRGNDNG